MRRLMTRTAFVRRTLRRKSVLYYSVRTVISEFTATQNQYGKGQVENISYSPDVMILGRPIL